MASNQAGQDRRTRKREPLSWKAKIETLRGNFDCRVLDLSAGGAMVRLNALVLEQEPVTLVFTASDHIEGVVAWRRNTLIGIRFLKETDIAAHRAAFAESPDYKMAQRMAERVSQARESMVGRSSANGGAAEPAHSGDPLPLRPQNGMDPAEPQQRATPALASKFKTSPATERAARPQAEPVQRTPIEAIDAAQPAALDPAIDPLPILRVKAAPRPASRPAHALLNQIQSELIARIDTGEAARLSPEALARALESIVAEIALEKNIPLNGPERAALIVCLVDEMTGFGPLEPLLADETVNDILVDGAKRVYVERGGKLQGTDVTFTDNFHVMNIATRIVTRIGRRVDESVPLVDARLPDGSRVNVIIPPLAIDGPTISIRKFAKRVITLEKMIEQGSLSAEMAALLSIAIRSRLNILISGGTGSGKTTLLNALSRMIDPNERIITIEDAAELQLQQPRVVRLETRVANLEGKGEITIRDLFRNALRMRPDRIIVGEIRGSESFDMLQAMNSGHDGSLGTIHASGPREALTRLENILDVSGVQLAPRAARTQIASAIDLIVQVSRMRDGKRRVTGIMEVIGTEGEVFVAQELFHYRFETELDDGNLAGSFVCSHLRPHFTPEAEFHGLGRQLQQAMGLVGQPAALVPGQRSTR